MSDAAVQSDLSRPPRNTLLYCASHDILLQALVYKVTVDLVEHLAACQEKIEALLEPAEEVSTVDVLLPGFMDLGYEAPGDTELTVEQDTRLCKLRLEKVKTCWTALCSKVNEEVASMQMIDDDYGSTVLDEAECFFGDIAKLMQSDHTDGVYMLFMDSFGQREGSAAVLEHMSVLELQPTQALQPVLQLALAMLVNNRCVHEADDCFEFL